jgi:hypothetical protein
MHLTYHDSSGHKATASTANAEEAGAPEIEIEITPAMIEAGMEAAALLTYRWGETAEPALVSRVFAAMLALSHPVAGRIRVRSADK